mgnify:CR=1 FL=1
MAVYDAYLKSNGIASGVNSYDDCVDMLVSWLQKIEAKKTLGVGAPSV